MSRTPIIKGSITRSFGRLGSDEVVATMSEDGAVTISRIPTHRRLRRGEKLPSVRIDVLETAGRLRESTTEVQSAQAILERIADRLPIAKFEEDSPRNVAYAMKVWLLKELNHAKAPTEAEEPPDQGEEETG